MSAEIEVAGSTASSTTVINAAVLGGETEESALAIFATIQAEEQKELAAYDEACGTHTSESFTDHSTCEDKEFLCGAGASDAYGECLQSIDCQMHHEMAVSVADGASKFATFARQMIPHHQNAVAMAKVLQKFHTDADYPAAGTEDQDKDWAEALVRNIINIQNFQIQQLQGWLDANPTLAGASSNCYDDADPAVGSLCSEIKAAYKNSSCCGSTSAQTTSYTVKAL
jgi:uncharacterized protein (DUF305 family)